MVVEPWNESLSPQKLASEFLVTYCTSKCRRLAALQGTLIVRCAVCSVASNVAEQYFTAKHIARITAVDFVICRSLSLDAEFKGQNNWRSGWGGITG